MFAISVGRRVRAGGLRRKRQQAKAAGLLLQQFAGTEAIDFVHGHDEDGLTGQQGTLSIWPIRGWHQRAEVGTGVTGLGWGY